jgi:hypothetical protein
MPVSGIPDPEQHCICIRCGQWFDPFEGEVIPLERANPVGRMADSFSGDIKMRFRCDGCTQVLARRRLTVMSVLAAVLFALVVTGFWLLYQK